MIDILLIAVIYNTYDETLRFLRSIDAIKYEKLKIILVDNSENADKSKFKINLKEYNLNLDYLEPGTNTGYFGGADVALSYYLEKQPLPEWVIVSNVDVVFKQTNFFTQLSNLKVPGNVGVVAPSIISERWKTDSNPKILERYSFKKMKFYLKLYRFSLVQNAYILLSYIKKRFQHSSQKQEITGTENDKMLEIYAPHGSCIIFNKIYFEKGGTLKHISFLFGEEIFVAETCRNNRLKVVYYPALRVDDFEHASTGIFYSKKIARLMRQSTLDIISHYYM